MCHSSLKEILSLVKELYSGHELETDGPTDRPTDRTKRILYSPPTFCGGGIIKVRQTTREHSCRSGVPLFLESGLDLLHTHQGPRSLQLHRHLTGDEAPDTQTFIVVQPGLGGRAIVRNFSTYKHYNAYIVQVTFRVSNYTFSTE